ncbi:hypothetical protein KW805_04835 [Candidatus Pacearchaeota archaeon]|nr:hypothetical protein [Candidatus Pacearchaeota archaeon]
MRNSIKKNLAMIVLGSTMAAGLSGCGAAMQMAAPFSKTVEAGMALNAAGQAVTAYEVAEMNKTEVNVTVQQPQPNHPVYHKYLGALEICNDPVGGTIVLTTCKEFKDYDGDGIIMFPHEYRGKKERFSKNENISIAVGVENKVSGIHYILKDGENKTIKDFLIEQDSYGTHDDFKEGELETGTYTAEFYLKNRPLGKLKFTVED